LNDLERRNGRYFALNHWIRQTWIPPQIDGVVYWNT